MAYQELDASIFKIYALDTEIGQMRHKLSRKEIYNKFQQQDVELSQEALQSALATGKVTKSLLEELETDISHLKVLAFDDIHEELDSLKQKFEDKTRQ